jgi:hypothetical protein
VVLDAITLLIAIPVYERTKMCAYHRHRHKLWPMILKAATEPAKPLLGTMGKEDDAHGCADRAKAN